MTSTMAGPGGAATAETGGSDAPVGRRSGVQSLAARAAQALWGDRWRRVVLVAVVIGFGLRVWWAIYASRTPVNLHDPFFYLDYGRRLSEGGGYRLADGQPTAYYPIGYPAILGGWFWVLQHTPFRDHWIANASALNLIFGTASIALVAALARRLAGGAVAAVAAVLTALFPGIIFHTATILTETTFNFVFLAALLVLCWRPWRESYPSLGRLAVFGVLFAISVEVRPIALLALPMVAIALWRRTEWRRWLARMGVVTGMLILVMLPWTVRNQVVMHAFLPIGTTTGDNLCIGNHPGAQGHFAFPDFCFGDDQDVPRPEFETLRNTKLTSRALDWIVHHPAEQLHLIPQRTFYTFQHDHDAVPAVQSYGDDPFIPPRTAIVLGNLADGYFFGVLALAALGLPFLARRGGDRRRLLLLLSMVAVAIAPWPFFGDSRFHVPIDVLVPIPAAITVVLMARRWRQPADPVDPVA